MPGTSILWLESVPWYTPVPELVTNGQINGPFQRPQAGTFGSGRNPFYGPRFFNSDMSLFKNFRDHGALRSAVPV